MSQFLSDKSVDHDIYPICCVVWTSWNRETYMDSMTQIIFPTLGKEGVEPMEEGDGRTSKGQEATKRPPPQPPQQQSLKNFLTSHVPEGRDILPPGQLILGTGRFCLCRLTIYVFPNLPLTWKKSSVLVLDQCTKTQSLFGVNWRFGTMEWSPCRTGWVDFNLVDIPYCVASQPFLPNSHNHKQNRADCGAPKIKSSLSQARFKHSLKDLNHTHSPYYRHPCLQWHWLQWHPGYSDSFDSSQLDFHM